MNRDPDWDSEIVFKVVFGLGKAIAFLLLVLVNLWMMVIALGVIAGALHLLYLTIVHLFGLD